jgi:hypothetical protein
MAVTYTPIATQTLASPAASVTFTSIPQDYRDLIIVVRALASATTDCGLRFNADTSSNYTFARMSGNGSSAFTFGQTTTQAYLAEIVKATTTEAVFIQIDIMDYSATDKHTSIVSRSGQSATGVEAFASRWANTSAITSAEIRAATGSATFSAGATFSLYGIAA